MAEDKELVDHVLSFYDTNNDGVVAECIRLRGRLIPVSKIAISEWLRGARVIKQQKGGEFLAAGCWRKQMQEIKAT